MKTISQAQLQVMLARVTHALPITISAFVDARCRKTGNPYKSVRKLSKVNGFTGANYENSVNRQQEREGKDPSFISGGRPWGERASPALVEKDGKWYLAIQPKATAKPLYFTKASDAEPYKLTPKDKIAAFLPAEKSSAEAQGVDKEVVYRNYGLENIAAVTMNGETYRVRR